MKLSVIQAYFAREGELSSVLTRLFAHAPFPIQVFDPRGKSLLVNDAFRGLFGREPPPHYRVLDDEVARRAGVLGLLRGAFEGNVTRVPPFWYDPRELGDDLGAHGRRVGVESHFVPLLDETGAVSCVLAFFNDRTEAMLDKERLNHRA